MRRLHHRCRRGGSARGRSRRRRRRRRRSRASRSSSRRRPAAAGTRPAAPCRTRCRRRTSRAASRWSTSRAPAAPSASPSSSPSKEGQGNALMTGGLVMLGAILTNQSPVTLEQVTPIARLTGEYEVIVVPASSEIQTLDDLIAKFKEDPQSVSWGGGSAGGTDHMLVGLIAKAAGRRSERHQLRAVRRRRRGAGLDPRRPRHRRRERLSGVRRPDRDRRSRARSRISSAERLEGVDIPTLKEQGVDVELTNWRAVFAPPGHLGRGQAGAGRRGRQDGRERGLAEHAQGARLAGPLSAAGRVRRSSWSRTGSRSRPCSRTSAWCSSRRPVLGGPRWRPRGLRLGEAVLAAFVLVLGVFVAVETAMLRTGPGYAAIGPKLFPWLVAAGLLLVGVGAAVRGARRGGRAAGRLRARPAAGARGDGRARPADGPDEAGGLRDRLGGPVRRGGVRLRQPAARAQRRRRPGRCAPPPTSPSRAGWGWFCRPGCWARCSARAAPAGG